MKTLRQLLHALPKHWKLDLSEKDLDTKVTRVTSDSREVIPGALFVATTGGKQDGHDFIPAVQQAGAALVIGEKELEHPTLVPYLRVPLSRLALGLLAAEFYGNPSLSLKMLGVTGTSGKTTTTYLLESILQADGQSVGVIGTVNFRHGKKIYPSTHTTPGAVELQRLLAEMKADGVTAVVMEVSSHALKQHRVSGIAFDGMVFTNLTREHLDFHPDMDDYYRSKAMLFQECADFSAAHGKKPFSAVNVDDPYGRRLIQDLRNIDPKHRRFATFSFHGNSDFTAQDLVSDLSGIHGKAGGIKIESFLTARFNVQNILGAITLTHGIGVSGSTISKGIAGLRNVPGRLEPVPNQKGIHVWVDYAHKADALEKVLKTLHELKGNAALITVFGCGGDRDREKRPVMGKLSVSFSDFVFVTSDNPRTEDPMAIIQEIVGGIGKVPHYKVEPDRKTAIFQAIQRAKPGDLVLIAGKGHEDYQIIGDPKIPGGTRKIHFDDREVASEALRS